MGILADEGADPRLRILAYGREKCQKTYWAGLCAEAGFNVVFINGEPGGTQILKRLSKDAQKRVQVCDATDNDKQATFARFMAQFCRSGNKFCWDEQAKTTIMGLRNQEHSFFQFEPAKFTLNDVLVVDSYTMLARSVSYNYAIENKLDVTNAEKTEWDGYGYEGRFLDFVLTQIGSWPCHVIFIGHATVYEKYRGKGRERELISSTTQPISSSGPHAFKVGNKFNDVLFFNRRSADFFTINTGGSSDSVGGSRTFPPKEYKFSELSPSKFFEAVGVKPTGAACLGATWIAPGTPQQISSQSAAAKPSVAVAAKTELVPAPVLEASDKPVMLSGLKAKLAQAAGR